jgi:hypothetical protein
MWQSYNGSIEDVYLSTGIPAELVDSGPVFKTPAHQSCLFFSLCCHGSCVMFGAVLRVQKEPQSSKVVKDRCSKWRLSYQCGC